MSLIPSVRSFRIPALACALALPLCELISHPVAETGVCDDWSYIFTAQHLASTGHVVYIGWAAAMLGWQLYLGALFIKLFGFSYTTVRMATVLVAMLTAFLVQRSMVRSRITERNATIGTLALVLSPLVLELSATFMSDIYGLFAVVVCLYACIRTLQASTPNRSIAWLAFAATASAIGGSARQIAWLGVLVMVPSTLLLLHLQPRLHRRILPAGIAITLAGALLVIASMRWFQHQPYSLPSVPIALFSTHFPLRQTFHQFLFVALDFPFLLLPLFALFLPQLRKASRPVMATLGLLALVYALRANLHSDFDLRSMLEPAQGDWVSLYGIFGHTFLHGTPPLFLHPPARILFTLLSLGGVLGLIAALTRLRSKPLHPTLSTDPTLPPSLSWPQLAILLFPFTLAYIVLLIPVATVALFDRYMLCPLLVATICLVRLYQDRIRPTLPAFAIALIALMAILGVVMTHNTFSLYRARVALAAELLAAGVPPTAVDSGWESNMRTELDHAGHINFQLIIVPRHVYLPVLPPPGPCRMFWFDLSPHVRPLYAVSFDPDDCFGTASFAPIQYSQWLAPPATLYVIKFTEDAP